MEADAATIQGIVNANEHRQDPYWIVIFAKPSRQRVDGKPTLIKHIKAYDQKPLPQVGMIVGEVSNKTGQITWDVNMPQRPFDFDALRGLGAEECDEVVVETTSIPQAYVTR